MPTLDSIAADTVAAIGSDSLGYPIVAKWVLARYQQLSTRVKLKHLRQLGQVNIPAAITTGLATFTRGSDRVAVDSTAAAVLSASTVTGRYIRGGVIWYEIIGYSANTIFLKAPYAENTVTLGAYTIVSRFTPVDPRASWLGRSWVHARRRIPLSRTTMDALNLQAPYRPLVGSSGPFAVAEGPEINGVKTIEVYPYPATLEALFYVYWQDIPEFSLTEELSARIKSYALKEGALIDCYRYLMNESLKKSEIDKAGFYRNEMRTQETKWEQYLRELIGADQGDEDGQFILKMTGSGYNAGEIRTARDQVWAGH